METVIISLGGSLIIPEEIDVDFLRDFKELIISQIKLDKKFVIITGGGRLCRKYNKAAEEISKPSNDDLDWIGIASLRLNAELLRVIFGEYAHNEVIINLTQSFSLEKSIVIGSAYKPGWSSDWNAVQAAKTVGAKKVINLSNTDYVYDSDPKINPNAKKIEKISWLEYRKLIPKDWNPGLNSPFDPVASEIAEEEGMEVIIMNGKPIDNLAKYLNGEEFKGTVIV
ncbi:UMP kinase [Candidatus Nomurabacteria bacterium CG_4_9_14_0_2_um_filter_32_10]|uniref:UMP kinase n=2 Tax=Candidatus Nomuraibacteriota TaxID=1752729 RepID=A0A2J0ME55_9BACT|nr:MAG: UMP kinase [Candidatus Nomurabacteria bacterium CG_4_10_14_0_2_um_filter_33_9]PJC49655.1 MAG: UMP kinase [Candidatus Nomurabacteria bacterium CG_4_9_14_0_2_um_filter_32_10]